jgi:Xylanase inhibitor N-terminal
MMAMKAQVTLSRYTMHNNADKHSALQVRDKLYTGGVTLASTPVEHGAYAVDFMFGCISSQTGLFNTQLADGIMGMSASEYTLVWQLKQAGLLEKEAFSLCFHEKGGSMVSTIYN